MPYKRAICPNCGADIQIDPNMENVFCSQCESIVDLTGSIQIVQVNEDFSMDGLENFPSMFSLISHLLVKGTEQKDKLKQLLHRALEMDPSNKYIYDLIQSEIWNAEIKDSVFIQYRGDAENVVVPNGIITIADKAFSGIYKLKKVTLPPSVLQINERSFKLRENIIICAHKNSYAEKFAYENSVRLKIIDMSQDDQNQIKAAENLLDDINNIRYTSISSIRMNFDKQYKSSSELMRMIFFIPIVAFIAGIDTAINEDSTIILFVALVLLIVAGAIFILASVNADYKQARSELYADIQIKSYNRKCNESLTPFGIVNFKLDIDSLRQQGYDFAPYIRKLERSKSEIEKISILRYYVNPYTTYTFNDYMKDNRPDYSQKI